MNTLKCGICGRTEDSEDDEIRLGWMVRTMGVDIEDICPQCKLDLEREQKEVKL